MRQILSPFLLVLVLLMGVVSPVSAQSDGALVDRYDRLYASGKYELALGAAETICQRYPESSVWAFNAGALCAKLDRPDEAIDHLRRAAQNGYTGIASFEQNTDLDPIRDRDDFKAIIKTIRAAAKSRMDEFQREARAHTPKAYYPPEAGTKRPLIIALHGSGMDGQSMFDVLRVTAENESAILVCPDALRPSGPGFAWTYRDESEWFVNHLIDEAIEQHNADPSRVVLIGFSQGANIALILGQTQPERFAGVVPICGHYEAQAAKGDAAPAPFYLMTGARDPWKKTYTRARRDFEDAGGRVAVRVLTGSGHELPAGGVGTREYTRALRWSLTQDEDD